MGRIASTIVVALVAVLGLTGFVVVSARLLERSESAIAEAQFDFVLARADEGVERSLQLGLPLTELEQTIPLLERILLRAPAVEAADVFSVTGTTLFSTDRGAVGEPIPDRWRVAIEEARGETWTAETTNLLTIGRAITNDFGGVEGWAAIIIDRNAVTPPLSLLGRMLRASAGVIVLVAAIAAMLVAFDRLGLSRRNPVLAEAVLEADPGRIVTRDPFSRLTLSAVQRARDTDQRLAEAKLKMQALDAEV